MMKPHFLSLALVLPLLAIAADDPLTKPIPSPYAEKWLKPQAPVRLYGDTYYVGSAGMSNVLIHTDAGLILVDGGMPQSVALIEANIRTLGFRIEDIKYILSTEAHFDHAGGIAALARDSGAVAVTSPLGARALRLGRVLDTDPQSGEIAGIPAVANVRDIGDGETLKLGATAITAHFTPGHTPGSTTWSWLACEEGKCRNVVFSSSVSSVAADDYRFSDPQHAAYVDMFRNSIRKIGKLPCDILITAHPDQSDLADKLKLPPAPDKFIDSQACRNYANEFERNLDKRLQKENAAR